MFLLFRESTRMERNDVEEVIQIISKTVESIDSNCFITPVGGYRYSRCLFFLPSLLTNIIRSSDVEKLKMGIWTY